VLTNHELAHRVDTSDQWIVERTGIRQRHIAAPDELASDMALEAARQALQRAQIEPADLGLIIVGTISADQPLPSCAAHLQRKLGAHCPAFDLAAACAGFLFGLDMACRYVATGLRPVLVVGVELLSRLVDWTDRETCVLFGDGAGAAVIDVATDDGRGVLGSLLGSDGRAAHLLQIPAESGLVTMRGSDVFRLAVTQLTDACLHVLDQASLAATDVHLAVMHQANVRILQSLSRRISVPWDRFHITLDRFGNTSSASVPLGLDDAWQQGLLGSGQVVLMAALGAGAAWAAAVVRF
jgi:3-oxoacyl-[acyl-carrier-protein] synthase-3